MVDEIPEGWVHRYPVRVQFDEVDQYGIVHHSKFLIFFERARVDLLAELMKRGGGTALDFTLIVASANVRYRSSARFLDDVEVEQGVRRMGASRLELGYRVVRGEEVLADAELVLAFVGPEGRPVRAPTPLREALSRMGAPGA